MGCVIEKRYSYKTNFISLGYGDVFYDNSECKYIKIKEAYDENNNKINAISLYNGSHKKFNLYDSVYKYTEKIHTYNFL